MNTLTLDGQSLTVEDVHRHSTAPSRIQFSPASIRNMKASRALIEEWIEKEETVYGVTTGFGEFSNVRIGRNDLEELQQNLIVSHAAGTGEPLPKEIVRAMVILRLNALAKGFSGVRVETMEFIKKAFNAGVVPVIPSRGSVGSSGDLAPLAHLVLAMIGKGYVEFRNERMAASAALKKIGLRPLKLTASEGTRARERDADDVGIRLPHRD
jgi:histidine ammonia-lyase